MGSISRKAWMAFVVSTALVGCQDEAPKKQDNSPPVSIRDDEFRLSQVTPRPMPEQKAVVPVATLAVLPPVLDFGSVVLPGGRTEQSVRVQNPNAFRVRIMGVRLANAAGLAVSNNCPPYLAPAAVCDVSVQVTGTATMLIESAIIIDLAGSETPMSVPVQGLVQVPVVPARPAVVDAPPQPPALGDKEKRLITILRQRVKRTGFRPGDDFVSPVRSQTVAVKPRYKMTDADYRKLFPGQKEMFTYPVRRCRVVTEEQVIKAVLLTRINTQIGGSVHAMVKSPVYSADCMNVLLPRGTKLVGEAKAVDNANLTRVPIEWRRIFTPLGASIVMDGNKFQTADRAGTVGAVGHVDERLGEKLGTVFAVSAVSAALALAAAGGSPGVVAAQADLSNSVGNVVSQSVGEKLKIAKVVTIPQRTEVDIYPTFDLWFPEPRKLAAAGRETSAGGDER